MYRLLLAGLLFTNQVLAQLTVRKILPSATDAAIDRYTEPGFEHYVYLNGDVKKRSELFVFLPGTGGRGGGGRKVNEVAANLGYHVISLQYPDSIAMAMICKNNNDTNCFGECRAQLLTGGGRIEKLTVISKANSIENRLAKLLLYLDKIFPAENWKQFLTKYQSIRWDKIAIGGQSQGGGHAAYIAKLYTVARVLMFAAPKDYNNVYNRPGAWLYTRSKTAANRYFGFVHSMDDKNGCTFPQQLEIFRSMGLLHDGEPVNVDETTAPYNNARIFTSRKPEPNYHGCVILDDDFKPVWEHMFTAATD